MPAFSTHHLFAEEMMETIRKSVKGVNLDERAVIYGTQGPDYLFFHRILPTMKGESLNSVGSAMHKCDPARLFEAMAEYVKTENDYNRDTLLSYLCGFICHYALDRRVHPFVYWAVDDMKKKEGIKYHSFIIHNREEFNMDMIFLREKRNITNALTFSTQAFLSDDENLIDEMAKVSRFTCSCVLRKNIGKERFAEAYRDFRYMQGLINSGKKWHITLLRALQFPFKHFIGPVLRLLCLRRSPTKNMTI